MARSISDIRAAIAAARTAQPTLAGLTSPSATGLYRLIEYVVAVALWVHETLWDRFAAEVADTIARAPVGTAEWYADRAKEFQAGDALVVLPTGRAGYATPVPATDPKRIVTRAAAREADKTKKLLLKVATDGPAPGTLQPISAAQLTELRGYFDRVRFAGTALEVQTYEADRLRVAGQVYYDPLLDVDALGVVVRAAINAYLAGIPFDGRVQLSRLVDVVQAVAGVRDFVVSSWQARTGQVLSPPLGRDYDTQAGYVVEEDQADAQGQPTANFTTTLQFVPDVHY